MYFLKIDISVKSNGIFIVPSNEYIKEGEKLNIVTPEVYKEMCLESKPFKPFVINEHYKKIWEKEKE